MKTTELIERIKAFSEDRKRWTNLNYEISEPFYIVTQSELAEIVDVHTKLLEALKTIYRLIDTGILVRDISKDDDFEYFTKQGIKITQAADLAYKAIKKATS